MKIEIEYDGLKVSITSDSNDDNWLRMCLSILCDKLAPFRSLRIRESIESIGER